MRLFARQDGARVRLRQPAGCSMSQRGFTQISKRRHSSMVSLRRCSAEIFCFWWSVMAFGTGSRQSLSFWRGTQIAALHVGNRRDARIQGRRSEISPLPTRTRPVADHSTISDISRIVGSCRGGGRSRATSGDGRRDRPSSRREPPLLCGVLERILGWVATRRSKTVSAEALAHDEPVFHLPPEAKTWISAYVAKAKSRVGVYLTFERGPIAAKLYEGLLLQRSEIEKSLGTDADWQAEGDGKYSIVTRKPFPSVTDPKYRAEIIQWLRDTANRFVTTFRPRIQTLLDDFDEV